MTRDKVSFDSQEFAQDSRQKRSWRALLIAAAISRALVFSVALLANWLFGVNCQTCWDIGFPFLNLFSRWDSSYYAHIATHGYGNSIEHYWAFFPGYPIVMGAFGHLFAIISSIPLPLAVHFSGFLVSNLSFAGAIYYLYRLSKEILGSENLAFESALFLAFFPSGVFFSAVYSDSLFLMLTFAALYYWAVGLLTRSGVLGFLSALVKPVGLLLVVPLIYELLTKPATRVRAENYFFAALTPLGSLAFMVYGYAKIGTLFASFEAEREYWQISGFKDSLSVFQALHAGIIQNPLVLPFLILSIAPLFAFVKGGRSIRESRETAFHIHAFCLLIIYLFYASLESFPRYTITLIPTYWWVARWSSMSFEFRVFLYAVSITLLAIGTALFVNWYPFI